MWEKCLLSYRFTQHTVKLCALKGQIDSPFNGLICFCLNKCPEISMHVFPRLSDGGYKGVLPKSTQESPSVLKEGELESNFSDISSTRRSPPSPAGPSQHFLDPTSNAKTKGSNSLRPPPTCLDKYKCPMAAAPVNNSQGGTGVSQSPLKDIVSKDAPVSWKDPGFSQGPKREEETPLETLPLPPPPLEPPAHLTPPSMEGQRSPSPHFAPQRLTDKPPVSVSQQDEATER